MADEQTVTGPGREPRAPKGEAQPPLRDRALKLLHFLSADWSGPFSLLWAVGSIALASGFHLMFARTGLIGTPYMVMMLAVFVCCLFAGARIGLLTAMLAWVVGQVLVQIGGVREADINDLSLFVMSSGAMVGLTVLVSLRERAAHAAMKSAEAARSTAHVTMRELELMVDSATEYAICLLDPEGKLLIWNIGAERLFGWTEAEVVGQSQELLYTVEARTAGQPAAELAIARQEGRFAGRGRRMRKDGSDFLADIVLTRIEGPDNSLLGFGKVIRDVTQEQADADAIEAREVHLRSILATVPEAMIVIDESGAIQSFSATAETMFGYGEADVVGRDFAMLVPPPHEGTPGDFLSRYRDVGDPHLAGGARRVFGKRKDGTLFPNELTVAEAIGGGRRVFTAFLRDLTAREAAEARLQELQGELLHISRVSAVGTMATTLAHELNQPLTAVTNYVQTSAALLEGMNQEPESMIREALYEAGREALRAGTIVRRLREFVARGELDRTIEQIAPLLEDARALGMVGGRLRGIRIETTIADNVGAALVDRVQIQQVLVNLIRNAVEAIPEGKDGLIRLSVGQKGDMLEFTVADNGVGLTPDVARSLFDAFVSTKARGMGLGLSICRTIVEAHGGRIWAEALPDGGAAFRFTLPSIGPEPHDV